MQWLFCRGGRCQSECFPEQIAVLWRQRATLWKLASVTRRMTWKRHEERDEWVCGRISVILNTFSLYFRIKLAHNKQTRFLERERLEGNSSSQLYDDFIRSLLFALIDGLFCSAKKHFQSIDAPHGDCLSASFLSELAAICMLRDEQLFAQ